MEMLWTSSYSCIYFVIACVHQHIRKKISSITPHFITFRTLGKNCYFRNCQNQPIFNDFYWNQNDSSTYFILPSTNTILPKIQNLQRNGLTLITKRWNTHLKVIIINMNDPTYRTYSWPQDSKDSCDPRNRYRKQSRSSDFVIPKTDTISAKNF